MEAIIGWLSRVMFAVAGLALVGSMFLTVADVTLRSFGRPILGTFELIGLLGAVVIGFAIPQTSRLGGHVIMELIAHKLPRIWQWLLHVVTRLMGIGLFGLLAWNLWAMGDDFRHSGEVTPILSVPLYPVPYGIALCCVIECLVLFVELVGRKDGDT